jgi:hypothetical protein
MVPENAEIWKPNKRQAEFLAIPYSVFEGFYGGAAGGGKSEILLAEPCVKGLINHPKFHGIIFRRTFRQLEESLIPRAKEFYGWDGTTRFGGRYNDQKKAFTFPSGATIRFSYLETDDDAKSHQTAQYNYAAFDELTHFTEYQYTYVTTRVRTSVPDLPAYIRSASNPGGVGHTWVYKRFVEPAETGHVLLQRKLPNGKYSKAVFIPAFLTDNTSLTNADPDYINRLNILPEADRRALLYGDWHAYSGQVFTEFRAVHLPTEPDNAIHVVDPFLIPTWWPKIIAIDWGYSAMTWVGWAAISPDMVTYLYREYAQKRKYITEWASDVARLSQFDGNIKAVCLDPSAWQHRGDPKQIYQQFEESSGFKVEKAVNDRTGGKMLMHEYLRWQQRPARYIPKEGFNQDLHDRIFRMYGEERAEEYKAMFKQQPPEANLPKLRIFRGAAPEFIGAIQACMADDRRPEEVAEFPGDDPYDGGRYLLQRVHRYFQEAQDEFTARKNLDDVLKCAHSTFDMYMAMRKYDAETKNKEVAPRRLYSPSQLRGRVSKTGKLPAYFYH